MCLGITSHMPVAHPRKGSMSQIVGPETPMVTVTRATPISDGQLANVQPTDLLKCPNGAIYMPTLAMPMLAMLTHPTSTLVLTHVIPMLATPMLTEMRWQVSLPRER